MNWIRQLNDELERGFSKSDLEKLIGLPKNNLSEILKGKRVLSKISALKIDRYMAGEKIDPLEYQKTKIREKKKVAVIAKKGALDNKDEKKEELELPPNLSISEKMEWYRKNRQPK